MKITQGTLAAAILLSLTAGVASAQGINVSVGLSDFTVFEFHGMGVGGAVNVPFGDGGWSFNVDGRYELGNFKIEDESVVPTETLEQKLSGFRFRGGVDHEVEVGPARMYMGTGLSYASHKVTTEETGFPEVETEPYNVFGINSRLGGSVPLGSGAPIELFGQYENTLGWGSVEDDNEKLTQTDVTNGFQLGLRYRVATR
jgi:hypothetical protein